MDVIERLWYSKCATTESPSYPQINALFTSALIAKELAARQEIRQCKKIFLKHSNAIIVLLQFAFD